MRRQESSANRLPVPSATYVLDGVTILSVYLVLLYGVPSNRAIPALGSAGSVAVVWGLGAALWWGWYQIQRTKPDEHHTGARPVRIAAFLLFGSFLLSFVAAMTRPLPAEETGPADTSMVRLVAWTGILLLASDGLFSFERFMTLVRRLTMVGGLYAALGLLQFATNRSFVDLVSIPGLVTREGYDSIETRGGLTRAASTATHPLEYAMVLAMVLPIAITMALYDRKRAATVRWGIVAVVTLALALSGSRSAYIGMLAGLVVLIPTLTRRMRWTFAAAAVGVVAVLYVAAPRVITNVRYSFVALADDTSATSRTDSYGLVFDMFQRSPFFGRGFGTFLPDYRILDNQYLQLLIEVGLVGLMGLGGLLVTSIACALSARRNSADQLMRGVGVALAASVVSGAALLALFDAFSFPQAAGSLFLALGLCGSYWRLSRNGVKSVAVTQL